MREARGEMDREREDTAEFAARVAAPLKSPVTMSAGFDARVMRAVAEAAHPWWRRHRTFMFTPMRALAMAASLLLFVSVGSYAGARVLADNPAIVASATSDTVHVVRFVLAAPDAQSVSLVGDFNGWSRATTQMEPTETPGVWTVTLSLPSGRHEYAFVVDGQRWVPDPYAAVARDEFGNESSVVRVGGVTRGL